MSQGAITVVGRPGTHIDTIRASGLKITGQKEGVARIAAVDDSAAVKACDAIIYVVKTYDTAAILTATAHIEVRDFAVSLQNGAVKDELLVETFGRDRVISGVAVVAGERPEPGQISWTPWWDDPVRRNRRLAIGAG